MADLTIPAFELTSQTATVLFVLACIAGFQYRHVWSAEGPRWQLWIYGGLAALCLAAVAFLPVATTS